MNLTIKKTQLISFSTIILLLLLTGIYLLTAKRPLPNSVQTTPQSWLTYADPQKRFKVSYPPEWDQVVISGTLNLGPKTMIAQIKTELAQGDTELNVPSGITISTNPAPIDTTNPYQKTIAKQITVSGFPATEYTITYLRSIGFANAGDVDTIVVVKNQTNTWVITPIDPASKQIFDQILSTFTFTTF